MISIQAAVSAIVYLLVAGIIYWLLNWLIGKIDPPQPFRKVAEIILAVMAVLCVIGVLLSLATGVPLLRP